MASTEYRLGGTSCSKVYSNCESPIRHRARSKSYPYLASAVYTHKNTGSRNKSL